MKSNIYLKRFLNNHDLISRFWYITNDLEAARSEDNMDNQANLNS